ncbi:MAG: esterase/lipase family protein [Plesiomonas sp.]
MREGVIIVLHGLFMNGLMMQPFTDRLHHLGWKTEILTYNSVNIQLNEIYAALDTLINQYPNQPIYLVGHSLGGLIIRYYLHRHYGSSSRQRTRHTCQKIASVITLGTPHQRASTAARLQQLGLGWMMGNSGEHGLLQTDLPETWSVDIPLGTVAGTIAIGMRPLLFWQKDNEPNDGLVLVREAKIEGSADHIDIAVTHTNMIYQWDVIQQVDHFLQHQHFAHGDQDAQQAVNA